MKGRTIAVFNRILNSNLPIPLKVLSLEFQVSERTIRNELKEINDFLEDSGIASVQFIRSQGVLLKLSKEELGEVQTVLSQKSSDAYLPRNQRVLDIILDIAFGKEQMFLNKKEDEFQVSKSTIDEDIRQVRSVSTQYDVRVTSHQKFGFKFEGHEKNIRQMLYTLLGSVFTSPDAELLDIPYKYLSKVQIQDLDSLYSQYISANEVSHYRTMFILVTLVWMKRIESGNKIRHYQESGGFKESTSNKIVDYIDRVSRKFSISSSKEECSYLYSILKTLDIDGSYRPTNWLDLQLFILQFIKSVELETGIPFSYKDDRLQQSLYIHLVGMIERIKLGIQLSNPLKEKIKDSYQQVFASVSHYIANASELLGGNVSEDEIAFLTIHFSVALSEINQEQSLWYKAVVICNHGVATGRLLSEQLKEHFDIDVVGVYSNRELVDIEDEDFDILFSTVDIQYPQKPVLILDSILNNESILLVRQFLEFHKDKSRVRNMNYTGMFQSILELIKDVGDIDKEQYQALQGILLRNGLKINTREVQPMIQDILVDHHITFEKESCEWQEAIRKVAIPLLEDEVITTKYVDAMIESVEEYGPYIVIGPHLALAHARPEDGALKLGLSLSIFQEPVIFGHEENDPVNIIFCLSAVDAYSHLNVMKSLVSLIREEDHLQRLAEARNLNDVKQILFPNKEEA